MNWPIIPNLPYIVLLCAGTSLLGRYTARQSCNRVTCQVTRWASRLFWPLALLSAAQVLATGATP